jgi:hypothetical protein
MNSIEIQKCMNVSSDNGGMPGANTIDPPNTNIISVTELFGISVGTNGNGDDNTANPGSGLYTGEYDGSDITRNEGITKTTTWPYMNKGGFIQRPSLPTFDGDRLGQSAESQLGTHYTGKWTATDCHGSMQHAATLQNDDKFATNPTGPTIFPSGWKDSDIQRGGVVMSNGSTFGWSTIDTIESVIIPTGANYYISPATF